MPGFKPKNDKKIAAKEIKTVDILHKEKLEEFHKNDILLPKLIQEKAEIKQQLNNISTSTNQSPQIKGTKNLNNEVMRKKLITRLLQIRKQIKNIKRSKKQYYMDNSKYIFDYFQDKKDINENSNKKILYSFFKKNKPAELNTEPKEQTSIKKYMLNMDNDKFDLDDYIVASDKCSKCLTGETVPVENEGVKICKRCNCIHPFLIEQDKPTYKEPPKEISFFAYKRINHFREILAQFQAKESTRIEPEVIENIKKQIKKQRLTLDQLTNNKTKSILKLLGYNKYYEHIPFIKEKLGIKPPVMSIELEQKLCNLFMEIQRPYAKFCPSKRVNFLNYYYVLYKMCELLGEDSYLKHFYLLKDPVKRMEQDDIWRKICGELNWEFIPTP